MSLNTWIGMVVDAMLKSTADKKASAIYRTILGQKGSFLLDSILGPLALAVESGSTMHQSLQGLESKVIQLLTLAAKIWTCSNIPQEMPTREWLRQYLLVTLGSGVYDAWEKKDLIWAVYSYFTWKTPVKTEAGVLEAIYDLAMLAGLAKPVDGSNVIPDLLHTYEALSLSEAVIPAAAELAKKKHGDIPLRKASGAGDLTSVKALLNAGYRELEEQGSVSGRMYMMDSFLILDACTALVQLHSPHDCKPRRQLAHSPRAHQGRGECARL
jgi:hypothetical protein